MQNAKIKLISNITNEITLLVNDLQKEKAEKEFNININEENMYWSINWKTDKYLKEYFQFQIYNENEKYSLLAEHRVEDIFEHLSEEYFVYKEKTIKELLSITNEIILKTKEAVLEAIDKEFDSSI